MKTFKKILTSTCIFYTIGEFIILIGAQIALGATDGTGAQLKNFLSLGSAALVLAAAFLLAAFNRIFATKLPRVICFLLHYAGMLTSFLLLFVFILGNYKRGAGAVLLLIGLFTIIYALIAFVCVLVNKGIKNKKTDENEYENLFS